MYQTMARRCRPQTFAEVVGQEHVAQTLQNALRAGRVAHAYLFCGPRGCGKTSMARIFASALCCQSKGETIPCGACDICRDILRGGDVDVQEIDGASNNSVERVRELREQAAYVPARARLKVYIIDEVHMLTAAAFNALLKTLEEPPVHVKFILATTDPHKVLETIHSRCQRFDFRLVPPGKLTAHMRDLLAADKELGVEVEQDALEAVAAFSGGSVRDALVLLDQLLSFSQEKATREDVELLRGAAGAQTVTAVYESILSRDVKAALAAIDQAVGRGSNPGDFLDQLIEFGRDLLLVSVTGELSQTSAYGPAKKLLGEMGATFSLEHILTVLDVFSGARVRLAQRALSNPLVPLEIAVTRLAGLADLTPLADIAGQLGAFAKGAPAPASKTNAPTATPTPPERPAPPKAAAAVDVPPPSDPLPPPWESQPATSANQATATAIEAPAARPAPAATLDLNDLTACWAALKDCLRELNKSDLSFLGDVRLERQTADALYLSVPGGGSFVFEQLEDERRKARLAQAAGKVFGRPLKIYLNARESLQNAPSAPPSSAAACNAAANDPGVKLLLEKFDGEITNIED